MLKYLTLITLFASCASIQSLEGGPTDKNSPIIISQSPDSASINVKTQTITLQFDEYVKLNNVNNLLMISPSQNVPPHIELTGKKVRISLNDTLLPNTTYNIETNGSIVDNNENNPLDYKIIFSTGPYIDSLTYTGYVFNQYTNQACETCKVYLYKTKSDSSILQKKPDYKTLTNKAGRYQFKNLPLSEFYIIAINDKNNNVLLDEYESISNYKKIKIDTTTNPGDTLDIYPYYNKNTTSPTILKESNYGYMRIKFNNPITDSISFLYNNINILGIPNSNRDTFTLLYTPTTDTSKITIIYNNDTFSLIKPEINSSLVTKPYISNINNNSIHLTLDAHILTIDSSKIIIHQDSNIVLTKTILNASNTIIINFDDPIPNNLKINILDSFITTISNLHSSTDTIIIPNNPETNPKLTISALHSNTNPTILEIFQNENIIYKISITEDTTIVLNRLIPNTYGVRLINDLNSNTIWDTGNPISDKKAEPVIILAPIELRNNWDKELIINDISSY